jgi:hypothetical protein
MAIFKRRISLVQIQVIIWLFILVLTFLMMFHSEGRVAESALYALVNTISYCTIIYLNALVLVPLFFRRGKKLLYVLLVMVMLVVMTIALVQVEMLILRIFRPADVAKEKPMMARVYMAIFFLHVIIYLFSLPLRLAFDYYTIRKQQAQLQKRTAEAELNLLKAQVQPHFLFNTLNNIYFVAQRESPATAELLEKLSNIMRYFVDEGPQDNILLTREVDFIRDYIDLEKLRMRHPLQLTVDIKGEISGVRIPPMLMIPLVENVFKHGINKRSEDNLLIVTITVEAGRLTVDVCNRIFEETEPVVHGGNGLTNLTARLQLLYDNRYTLEAKQEDRLFFAHLNIPL